MDDQFQKCQKHQQQGIAIDLSQTASSESQYLCESCVTESYFSKNQVLWKNEVEEMLKEMKSKEYKYQKSYIEQKIEEYQSIQTKIQDYQKQYNNSVTKLLNLINQRIEEKKSQLDKLSIPEQITLNTQNIKQLSQFINENQKLNISELYNLEQENEFLVQLGEQLKVLQKGEGLKDIITSITELSPQKTQTVESIVKDSQGELKKIQTLPFKCKSHGLLITVVHLEKQQKDQRLLCPECLEDQQMQVTSLTKLNKLWIEYQGKEYETQLIFNTKREETLQSIILIFDDLKKQEKSLQRDINNQLIEQSNLVKKELMKLEQNQIQKNIQKLELDQIRKIVNILAQNDQMDQLKQQQSKIEDQDDKVFNEITQKLQLIEQFQTQSEIQYNQIIKRNQNDNRINKNFQQLGDYFKDITLDQKLFENTIKQLEDRFYCLCDEWKQVINQAKVQIKQNVNLIENQQNSFQSYINLIEQQQYRLSLLMNNVDQQNFLSLTDSNSTGNQKKQQKNQTLSIKSNLFDCRQKLEKIKVNCQISNYSFSMNFSGIIPQVEQLIINKIDNLKFSNEYKHKSAILSDDCKTVTIDTEYCLCICDQPIPQSGVFSVDFKLLTNQQFVGICVKDLIPQDFNLQDLFESGQGQYFMAHDKNVFVNYNFENSKNYKKVQDFSPFQINDIITVIVNQNLKQITWQNRLKNQSFTIDFKETLDFYFCVYSWISELITQIV